MSKLLLIWNPTPELMEKYNVGRARVIPDRDLDEFEETIVWLCSNSSADATLTWSVCQEMAVDQIRAAYAEGKINVDEVVLIVPREGYEDRYVIGYHGNLVYEGWPEELNRYSTLLDRILEAKSHDVNAKVHTATPYSAPAILASIVYPSDTWE